MRSLADALAAVALTLWVGGLWVVGFVVAPALFDGLDRAAAGAVGGRLFSAIAWVGLTCGAYLLLHRFARHGARALRQPLFWGVAAMLALVAAGHFGVQAAMESLRPQLADALAHERFAALHAVAGALYAVVSALGVAVVILTARER